MANEDRQIPKPKSLARWATSTERKTTKPRLRP